MNKRGSVLIIVFLVIIFLTILGGVMFSRGLSERSLTKKYVDSTRAFWLAEAGINKAFKQLKANFDDTASISGTLGVGSYSVSIGAKVNQARTVTSSGAANTTRTVEAIMSKKTPDNFYDNAIYSAGEVELKGDSYSVTGKVRYADSIDNQHNHVTDTITKDATIKPLANLDYQSLYNTSLAQNNVYIIKSKKLVNQATNSQSLPGSFWYSDGVPNVVYVIGDLKLNGNIGTVGGFFVVVGDVLTDPTDEQDAEIDGNGKIEGVIYTRGEFKVDGGGGKTRLNVDGGVWGGEEVKLNGNGDVAYNKTYMDAVKALGVDGALQITSWDDTQNPYSF